MPAAAVSAASGAAGGAAGPAVEQEIVRIAAGTAALRDREQPRLGALLAVVDPGRLVADARRHRLLALVADRCGDGAPEALRAAGAEERGANVHLAGLCAIGQDIVLETLAAHHVRAVPFKGVAAARRLDPGLGLRSLSDLDILVPRADLAAAATVLRDLGYGSPADRLEANGLPLLHLRVPHPRRSLPPVELHWRVHWYEEEFAEAALRRACGPHLDPVDEFIVLLLCYARDGFLGLRLAADVAAWWDAEGAALDVGAFRARRAAHPALAAALDAALLAAGAVVGIPVRGLVGAPSASTRLAARLRNWGLNGDHDQAVAEMNLIDVLLAPAAQRPAVLRRHLAPPRAEIADWYALPDPRSARARLLRAVQAPKSVLRWMWALAALGRARPQPRLVLTQSR